MAEINVAQLLKSPIGSTRSYDIDETVKTGDGSSPVRGVVTLLRTNRGILVTGKLDTDVELTCSRCLGRFRQPLALQVEEEYFPTMDVLTGAPVAVPDDEPGAFTIDDNNILDLGEAVRQYSLMATPMKPLCRADCPGICPVCGSNLNVVSCNCPRNETDPRWQKLLIKQDPE
jgi:uncharacterized protein